MGQIWCFSAVDGWFRSYPSGLRPPRKIDGDPSAGLEKQGWHRYETVGLPTGRSARVWKNAESKYLVHYQALYGGELIYCSQFPDMIELLAKLAPIVSAHQLSLLNDNLEPVVFLAEESEVWQASLNQVLEDIQRDLPQELPS